MYQARHRSLLRAFVFGGLLSFTAGVAAAQTPPPQTPPDNTKVNKRDRAAGAVTADQQKENATDREIAAKIRKAIVDDKTLSTYAHNIKVVVQGGKVTLKGPVRTDAEKTAVAAKAGEIAGAANVTDNLTIAPEKTAKAAKHAKKATKKSTN
jgi:osmotically-inducible protein OsmY